MSERGISRRTALLAGAGAVAAVAAAGGAYGLVESGALPGKYRLAELLGDCGGPPDPPKGPLPVRRVASFWSAYRRRRVAMVTLIPAQAGSPRGLGVVVALHGLGGDADGTSRSVALAMAADGVPRSFAAITVDGDSTYWHRRADGDDPQGMIIHEVLPRAAALGLRTGRVGVVGDSMGGYGAVLLAERLAASGKGPGCAAVGAIKPAIFASYADARQADAGSFDGPADFTRNDILTRIAELRDVPAYVACGSDDPFEPMAQELRARLTRVTGHAPAGGIAAGCHDHAFWARSLPAALSFISLNLP